MSRISVKGTENSGTDVPKRGRVRPVKFVTSRDGVSLAWSRTGQGRPLIKASAWLTHLQHDAESPVWAHFVEFLEGNFDYLRYDERGCGMSDRNIGQPNLENWTDDLVRTVEVADFPAPFILLAMSQGAGTAVSFAARYPEKVSHLIILGGYARGVDHRGNQKAADLYHAITDVFSKGFDEDNPAFREVFTKRFLPNSDPERLMWFTELCRRATDAETGAKLLRARAAMDASAHLADVRAPTLVVHARSDAVVPVSEGRFIAQNIPNAEFQMLDSANHILQADEPAWDDFRAAMMTFLGDAPAALRADLTPRERAILSEICEAKSNKQIARDLDMSEKTVRNHATRIFAKLGVTTRQEAIVKVRGG